MLFRGVFLNSSQISDSLVRRALPLIRKKDHRGGRTVWFNPCAGAFGNLQTNLGEENDFEKGDENRDVF